MNIKDHFSPEEMAQFQARSDAAGWLAIVVNWGIVAAAFALVAAWPNPLTVVLALVLLGGRQLGFGALMHECGHNSLFRTRWLNHWVGKWLAAGPVFYRIEDYMANHLAHHRNIGTTDDPDLGRYQHYPVDSRTLRRKFGRDLTGRTTLGFFRFIFRQNGVLTSDEQGHTRFHFLQLVKRFHAALISNGILLGVLALSGHAYLYLLWVAAYFSFYMLFSRIRNLAEHAVVPELFDSDPRNNTRTTLARWWERLTVAPNSVNYHLEHHLVPSIPKYRLALFHRALREKELLQQADITVGYAEVVRKLIKNPMPQAV